ncbi:P22 phage major capsid protein family protein [Arthrobacter sp. AQ5-05]|uniref:P22 phage major capsid protein family protein n=1 Tax=Arthrobacter sp. AQ5-05 TaxID=2184581 RepID=UPI0015EC9C32|nr:P22 phage major capsid protein family protein [Arthrobacter sp. AQ5-05]
MANTLLIAEQTARVAATIVGQDMNLAALVHRDLEADFAAGKGATVKVRVPGAVASQTRGIYDTSTPLVSDEIAEQSIDVTLTEHVYDKVALSEGTLNLDIKSFSEQVLRPQSLAVAKHVERAVAAVMKATPEDIAIAHDPLAPAKTFTQIRRKLRTAGVSTDEALFAAVGPGVYAELLDHDAIDDNGKVRGIEIHESTRLADDEIVGFIRPAFALVVRAPQVPNGAPYGASITEGGFALRHIMSYDDNVAADRSLVSAFVGVKAMPLPVDLENGTIELRENGGAVRVLTSA